MFSILDTTAYKELSVDSWVTGRKPFATSLPNTVTLLAQSVTKFLTHDALSSHALARALLPQHPQACLLFVTYSEKRSVAASCPSQMDGVALQNQQPGSGDLCPRRHGAGFKGSGHTEPT